MKTPSSFLYDLVKRLTKSEKRYIRLQAGPGEKDYLQLLDALLAQPEFDEEQLIRAHTGANFLRNLPVNKRYLYDLLLRQLEQFHRNSEEDRVQEKVAAAKVLMDKGLFEAAAAELKKGHKIAERYELFEQQIQLCGMEKRLSAGRPQRSGDGEAIRRIYALEQHCLDQLKNTNDYWYLAQQIGQFQMQFQKAQTAAQREYLEQLTGRPEFKDLSRATNLKSRIYYFQANAIYQFMQGNVEAAYRINRSFLDLLDAHPQFLKLYAERYLATLNNILIDSLLIGNYALLEKEIERLSQLSARPEFRSIKNIEARIFRQRYLLLINWCLNQKDFARALSWIPDIEAGLERFGKQIEKHHRVTFYYLIAYFLFQNRRFGEALTWNNRILNDPKEEVVKEVFSFARVLNLLIHYELSNYGLLEALLSSTPKFLKARRPLYAGEKALFRLLARLLKATDRAERQAYAASFKAELEQLARQPEEKRLFDYLDLRFWELG